MKRHIPAIMATQHPDNASAPFWDPDGNSFINALAEARECVECFEQLGVDEYMWDWEGKHADAAVVDKLLSEKHAFFQNHQLARDIFLTFRIPNIWNEKGYSLIQAMTAILIAEDFARDLGFKQRPLFEVILPMTERAEQLMKMHDLFYKLANFKSKTFNGDRANTDYLEMIPLFEGVFSQLDADKLLQRYLLLHQKRFGAMPPYIRPFLARSDPAMASGLLATVLANKIALSRLDRLSKEQKVPFYPIIGVGGLPFRGGLTPAGAAEFVATNPGIKTITLQSSFRYDYPVNQVKQAVTILRHKLPKNKASLIKSTDEALLSKIAKKSEAIYQSTLKKIVHELEDIFKAVPRRRERRLHIGLLAYQRTLGQQSLPRAITFTCGFYSVGVPPEFIGLGRSLSRLSTNELKKVIEIYPGILADVERAGRYINYDNLHKLVKRNAGWQEVAEDIALSQKLLKLKFGPRSYDEHAHKNLSSNVLLAKNNRAKLPGLIIELAKLRKSLG